MNFEVFSTEAAADARRLELASRGAFVIQAFNGRAWTVKWSVAHGANLAELQK